MQAKSNLIELVQNGFSTREIANMLGVGKSTVHRWCQENNIILSGRVEQLLSKRCTKIRDSLFHAPLDEKHSWLLGIIATDGCVEDGGRLTICNEDIDVIKLSHSIIGMRSIRCLSPRPPKTTAVLYNHIVNSRILCNRLNLLGIVPRKTKTIQFPQPEKLSLPDYVRGLWDGDGCWSIDKRDRKLISSFGSASLQFIKVLASTLQLVTSSKAQVRQRGDKYFWVLSYYGTKAISLANWLYENAGMYANQRKKSIVSPFLR